MRVAFLGNFRPPYSSENDYLWTMRSRMDLEVTALQEKETSGGKVLEVAAQADLFLWVHTHGWQTPGLPMEEVLGRLRALGVPSSAYHLDLYMPLGRWQEYEAHEYLKVEHFFTVDKLMADWLSLNTKTQGHFLRAGVVERDCGFLERPKTHDVVFVGSYHYHPEWPYRSQLIDWLRRTYGDRFEHWGPQGLGLVRGQALNELYASTKVVIGDTLSRGFEYPYYTSDRAYEVLGRGGFLVHPRIRGMEAELTGREHLAYYDFNDWAGLKRTIDYHLEHEEERERIRRAGQAKVASEYTYTHRLAELFRTLGF